MHGVVNGVQVLLLGQFGQLRLAEARAKLSLRAQLQVLLGGRGQHLAEQLGKLGGVLRLFQRIALERLGHLGVALALRHAAHGQIHAHFAALALEVGAQAGQDLRVTAGGHADDMLRGIGLFLVHDLDKLAAGRLALGAKLGRGIALIDVTADGTTKLLHRCILLLFCLFVGYYSAKMGFFSRKTVQISGMLLY